VIERAPVFMKLHEKFVQYADGDTEDLSDDLTKLAQVARRVLEEVKG
jgi:hypothetical protein